MTSRDERIKLLSEKDWEIRDIAREVGLSTRQVTRIRRRLGLSTSLPLLTEEQRKRIRHLSEVEGWPPEEIAATMGLSLDAACRWSVRGPGKEWAAVASALAVRHRRLWSELRGAA